MLSGLLKEGSQIHVRKDDCRCQAAGSCPVALIDELDRCVVPFLGCTPCDEALCACEYSEEKRFDF